jgi:glycosyltransferase involved in cell wall biosynthesis
MKVLALEPYYGGSHKAFLDGWIAHSRHDWTILSLPPNKWKWRMRHSAITLTDQVVELAANGKTWDLLFCSDMLGLAEFRGLAPAAIGGLPALSYFHENQLTYPVEHPTDFDYHFVFSNMMSALAANWVWFNSAYNRDSFLSELKLFLKRMPDRVPLDCIETIRAKSDIRPPGIEPFPDRKPREAGPLRILWCARWEYDKDPDTFFAALEVLESAGIDFRLNVIGGGDSREVLPSFKQAKRRFKNRIDAWGYQGSREEYVEVLTASDVAVSTARHEFFGISMVEAAAAGVLPLVPRRLAYPEVFGDAGMFFYDGSAEQLVNRLRALAERVLAGDPLAEESSLARRISHQYLWEEMVPAWDNELCDLARTGKDCTFEGAS